MLATVPTRGTAAQDGAEIRVLPRLDEVVAALESGRLAAAAIDIPIGLAADGSRACDHAARRLLGPRRSSVFPAPVRAVLGAASYEEACAVSRGVWGKGLSKQLYNILGKIREVDELLSPRLQRQLFEGCPELSFAVLSGGEPMRHAKRTAAGRAERVEALQRAELGDVAPLIDSTPPGTARDDVFDALVLAWTARRYVASDCVRLGGEADGRGLRMEISA